MEATNKSKRWMWVVLGSAVLVCAAIFALRGYLFQDAKKRSISSMPTTKHELVVLGVDAKLDKELLLNVAGSVPGVRASTYSARSQILSLETTKAVFQKSALARALEHVGLGGCLEGQGCDEPYGAVRERLLKARAKRRAFFENPRDEIVFKKEDRSKVLPSDGLGAPPDPKTGESVPPTP